MARFGPVVLLVLAFAAPAAADPVRLGKFRFDPGGLITAVRVIDVDGDGRRDLVALVSVTEEGVARQDILVLRTPKTPKPGTFYGDEHVTRIRADRNDVRGAGALAVGRFGPDGGVLLRLLTREGIVDLEPNGSRVDASARFAGRTTLLGRSQDRSLVFWDEHADLDGDGVEEIWYPHGEGAGAIRVESGKPGGSVTLALEARSRGVSDHEHLLRRHAYVPSLVPADLDGDGRMELAAFRATKLVGWPYRADGAEERVPPTFEVGLPFVKENLGPDEVHTPRLDLLDVDGDGVTDLVVTLVTGDRRQLGSFRTRLLHYPGPFRDEKTGDLVAPRVRIDTESVALHTHFLDLDGDGDVDYVTDSIRGTKLDLLKRVFGQPPTIWYVGFRYARDKGTFETAPYFSLERPYSLEETVGNRFGRTGYFEGDFDGDGHRDLLDLAELSSIEILGAVTKRDRGPGDPVAFSKPIQPRVRVPDPLRADAVVADLNGDGRADAVVWGEETAYLLVSEATR